MAIGATMSQDDNKDHDQHDHDMVMPGFRFHPTEEELVEFYLRRKVEGKRFNVELITFLDLYRYDPWELPALAAIGEKEWYFYVPRDRKYRNGDRPNRVTTSGYWKATGADRMIRTEDFRAIGLKKTLVFYSGKAPKGIRTSWIMNEYRLPHHETERLQKAEISLCRVYKRAGVEDHPSLPRSLPTRASSSQGLQSDKKQHEATQHAMERFQALGGQSQQAEAEKMSTETSGSSSTDVGTALGFSSPPNSYISLVPNCTTTPNFTTASSFVAPNIGVDDLHRLVNYQQASINHDQQQYHNHHDQIHPSQFSTTLQPQSQSLALNTLPGSLQAAFPDRLWEWTEANKDYNSPFK
uniref:NAC domain-containing protein n=1 Tax=Davidia involucrata TaxID=16924 RepID=A0A5B7BDS6_DAVIN